MSVAKSLPAVGQPYELVVALLRILSARGPSPDDDLSSLLHESAAMKDVSLKMADVDPWVRRALGLVERRGDQWRLTDVGASLAELEGTAAFNCQFLRHTVDRSRERFSYFLQAYEALEQRRIRGAPPIPADELNVLLNQTIANRMSGPVIRRLLVGLGVLAEQEGSYAVYPVCSDETAGSPELRRLVKAGTELIELEQLSWESLLQRLGDLVGEDVVSRHTDELRDLVRLASTRSNSYVVGFKEI